MRTTATVISLLLATTLLAGCGNDTDEPDAEPSTAPSASTEAASPSATEAPHGPTIDRPGYSYNLPEDWKDTTKDQMLARKYDSYATQNLGTIEDSDTGLTVTAKTTFPKEAFLNAFPSILESERVSAPKVRRVRDTEWAGAKAAHAQGRRRGGMTYIQIFYFWHNDAGYYISLETVGARKKNEKLLDVIRSSWTWK